MKSVQDKSCFIFDFDGTLADTLDVYYSTDMEILAPFGVHIEEFEYKSLAGFNALDYCKNVIN